MHGPKPSPGQLAFRWTLRGFCGAVFLFLAAPILAVVPISFTSGSFLTYPLPGLSTRWYETFFASPLWVGSFKNSLIISGAVTLLATVLGTCGAYGLVRLRTAAKPAILALVLAPMIVPTMIFAVGSYLFFARLGLTATYLGIILAHTALASPFVVFVVYASLRNFDMTLPRAAASLGASPLRAFVSVTLPLTASGVFSGSVIAFATSLDEVVVALFLTGPEQRTLPIQMFTGLREQLSPTITAAAVLMLGFAVVLLGLAETLRPRGGEASRP